jgi:Mg2+ and Co2+ transporter CorA
MGVVEARLEAREAVEQGRETVRQGRTIMLFTVVTIIFMPLSFVASVFGMNVAELNDGKLSIRTEFAYMCK